MTEARGLAARIGALLAAVLVFIGLMAAGVFLPGTAQPAYASDDDWGSRDPYGNGYYFKTYWVEVTVNEDNSYDITETLDCWFDPDAYKHGIIRSIPLENEVVREDGSSSSNRARISDIHVKTTDATDYEVSKEYGECRIKIGRGDVYVKGDYQYIISYHYELGRDPLNDADEIYLNIIGTQWDTSIDKTEFKIHFPEGWITEKKLPGDFGFAHGGYGSGDYSDVYYKWEGDDLVGYYHHRLPPYNGLTFRMELPEGTFLYQENIWDKLGSLFMALPFVGLIGAIVLYLRRGRSPKAFEPVEFYPPNGMSPADVGFYYDGSLDDKDISSLLIYLADQGYLNIEEVDRQERDARGKKAIRKDGHYRIHLLKAAYEGNDAQVKAFFNGLKSRARDGIVREKDLEDSFYTVINKIRSAYRRRKYYEPIQGIRMATMLGGFLMMVLAAFMMFYKDTYYPLGAFGSALGVCFSSVIYVVFFALGWRMRKPHPVAGWLIIFFVGIHMIAMESGILAVLASSFGNISDGTLLIGILGVLSGFITVLLGGIMRKRTDHANELYGKIRGFRTFLEKAEKPRLEMLVEENPSYFYNILPYTYVLGLSSKWIKKFDSIVMDPPSWYIGTDVNDWRGMAYDIGRSMDHISGVMKSSPVSDGGGGGGGGWSSGGGGFSSSSGGGGGFSGGGSGGGGGSSW